MTHRTYLIRALLVATLGIVAALGVSGPVTAEGPQPAAPAAIEQSGPCGASRTITLADNGRTFRLATGRRFLLNLDQGYIWTVTFSNPKVVQQVCSVGEGVYEGVQRGETTLTAVGNPPCYPLCLAPSRLFQIKLVVR